MTNNIIFILFVILFILVILWLNTSTKEGFEDTINNNTTTPANFSSTAGVFNNTTPTSNYSGTTTPSSGSYSTNNTTPAISGTTPPITESNTGVPSDCQYIWSDWSKCDLTTGLITRKVDMIPAQNGGTACVNPPASALAIPCLNTLNFASNLRGWTLLFSPDEVRSSKNYYVSVFNSKTKTDTFGFTTSPFNTNYVRVRLDNTDGTYMNYDAVTVALQTTIPRLAVGNYLLTYYVQSRVSDMDTQSIGVYVAANQTRNTPLLFRTADNQPLIKPGTWVKQTLAFEVQPSDPVNTTIQLIFQLFDTQTTSDNIVAIGGIQLQSCGNTPCSVDCTYIYGDWSYCDFPSGKSTRTIYTLPPVNQGAACVNPPAEYTQQNCFNSINFANSDLSKSGWNLIYNPAGITSYVNTLITNAVQDTKFGFDNEDAQFKTPYAIINFDNTSGNLSLFTNPNIIMQTSMQLAPGNYRMTYFLQSWDSDTDSQSIWVNAAFGNGVLPSFNSKGNVVAGTWFPQAMEFTVGTDTKQPVQLQFQFILKDRTKGLNHAIAIGGIKFTSCKGGACPIDCLYVWDYWQQCDKSTNTTYRDPLVLVDANKDGLQCPVRDVSNCSVIPQNCQYSWGEWSKCVDGSTRRTRTEVTMTPGPHGKRCKTPQTETRDDCVYETNQTTPAGTVQNSSATNQTTPAGTFVEQKANTTGAIDCQYQGWTDYSKCVPGSTRRQRTAITRPASNGGTECTPGTTRDTTLEDCPVDCQYQGWTDYSTCVKNIKSRQRTAITRQALNGGTECTPGTTRDTTLEDCPVDCAVKKDGGHCDKDGFRYYNLKITRPKNGTGKDCKFNGNGKIFKSTELDKLNKSKAFKTRETCPIKCRYTSLEKYKCDGKNMTYKITGFVPGLNDGQCLDSEKRVITPESLMLDESGNGIYTPNEPCTNCSYTKTFTKCIDGYRHYKITNYVGEKNGGNRDNCPDADVTRNIDDYYSKKDSEKCTNCVGAWTDWGRDCIMDQGCQKERTYNISTYADNGGDECPYVNNAKDYGAHDQCNEYYDSITKVHTCYAKNPSDWHI